MIQEDKELVLQDLCARLPYGVIGLYSWKKRDTRNKELTGNVFDELTSSWNSTEDSEFLPYLRPMSSMTEEERKEHNSHRLSKWSTYSEYCANVIDWLNAHHFDYRGLIEKGLAIAITEDNNPYKE
ncbi:hypothetical protein J6O48_14130 [bacterium]|nr:hypothetical protein [bacterium]